MLSKKELEYLRPWVCKTVIEVLGFPESIIVNAAVDCIGRSLTRQATTGIITLRSNKCTPVKKVL